MSWNEISGALVGHTVGSILGSEGELRLHDSDGGSLPQPNKRDVASDFEDYQECETNLGYSFQATSSAISLLAVLR